MRTAAFDPDGHFMCWVYPEYEAKATARGEAAHAETGELVVIPQPMNELTGDEKRRIQLAKERAKR